MENGLRGDRRLLGVVAARLRDLALHRVRDPRARGGSRWTLSQLLCAALTGHVAGCRSLAETEELTENLSQPLRLRLDIPCRAADTTMRDVLVQVDPEDLRRVLHRQVRAANRRKQLGCGEFPFGVVAIDGKCTSTRFVDDRYAQRQHLKAGDEIIGIQGLVRTLTCCLVTSSSKVCLDAIPIPAQTNEMGHFAQAFRELIAQYGRSDLFQMVTLDAGFNSAENATLIHDAGYGYLVRLSDERRDLMASAVRRLATSPPTKPPLKPRSSWARPP